MKQVLCSFVLLYCFSFSYAQRSSISDSLINLATLIESDTTKIEMLQGHAAKYIRIDNRVATELLDYLTEFYQKKELKYRADRVIYHYGSIKRREGKLKESLKYFNEFLESAKLENHPKKIAMSYLAISNCYNDMKLIDSSLMFTEKSIHLYEEQKDTLNWIKAIRNMGTAVKSVNRIDDTKKYYRRALELSNAFVGKAERNEKERAMIHNDLGSTYQSEENLDSMEYYYEKFHEYSIRNEDKFLQIYSHYNKALAYQYREKFNDAAEYAKQATLLAGQANLQKMYVDGTILTGVNMIKAGRIVEGKKVLNTLDMGSLTKTQKREYHEGMYSSFKSVGKYKLALEHFELFKVYTDSIISDDMFNRVSELELKFQRSQNEKEIVSLNTQNDLMGVQLKRASRERIFFILGLLGLATILYLLYRAFQSSKLHRRDLELKNNEIQEALSDKETLLREIHHRVKNNLQVISSLLSLQSRQIDDPTAQKAIQEGRNRVKSMALIHQNLYQDEDLVGVDISEYITKLTRSLVNSYQVSDNIGVKTDIENIKMDVDQIIPLGLILNELISNALKYAFDEGEKGEISISLKTISDTVLIEVSDNGKGLPKDFDVDKLDSLGYKLIKSFTQKLKADLNISNQEHGTNISLKIPISNVA